MTDRLAQPDPAVAHGAPTPAHHGPRARTSERPRPRPPVDEDARDQALVTAHRAGDPTALTELLTRYQDRLYGVCFRMIGDPELASDLLQDAMVRIIGGISGFDGRSKLSTWMIRIAMNACLTELRRRKLRRHVSLDAPASWGDGGGPNNSGSIGSTLSDPGELSPAQRVVDEDDRRRLFRALSGLDPEQRAILILRDAQGLDYRRIAEVLEIPEGTVKSRLFRSRFALRQEMERLEAQPEE